MAYSSLTRRLTTCIPALGSMAAAVLFMAISLAATGGDSENYKRLLEQADSLFRSTQYDSALCIASVARDKAKETFGEQDTSVATALFQIGRCHYMLSSYEEAEYCWLRSLSIREELLGKDHPQVGQTLNGLGAIKMGKSEYQQAEDLFTHALDIAEKSAGPEHPDALRPLSNLAVLSMWKGNYKRARRLHDRVVAITESAHGSESPKMLTSLTSLALISRKYEEYDAAESFSLRAIAIIEESYGSNHPKLCKDLLNLGNVYRYKGELHKAKECLKRYLEIRRTQSSAEGLKEAAAWTILGRVYYDLGDSASLKDAYERALSVYEENFDLQYQGLARDLERFSWHFRPYNGPTCTKFAHRAFEIRRDNLLSNYYSMSENEALLYALFMRGAAAHYLSCHFDAGSVQAPDSLAADIVFSCKGQVSEEIFERAKHLSRESNALLLALRDSLGRTKERLSKLYTSSSPNKSWSEYWIELDGLHTEKKRLESGIAKHSSNLRRSCAVREVTTERIASHLPDSSVLVEYMKYHYIQRNPDTVTIHYLVALLKPDSRRLIIRDLGRAADIDSAVSEYRYHMLEVSRDGYPSAKAMSCYRDVALRLRVMIWQPIEGEIEDGQFVFIAPDGALNLVSFAALPDIEGQYSIEKNPIHYLSSGRDVIRLAQTGKSGEGLLIMGDPDYDASAHQRVSTDTMQAHFEGRHAGYIRGGDISRSAQSCRDKLADITVDRLPATRSEVEQIIRFWRRTYDDSVYYFLDEHATEDNLKEFARGRRVVHLATHGFYVPSDTSPDWQLADPELPSDFTSENPLLLSGLLLAGSNLHGQLADSLGLDDGILTAEEVSSLDLSGVDLVVLSACETGLGEIEAGEGIYGLRRAFQMSGARTVISSLWPVADARTAEFMAFLYASFDQPLFMALREYQLSQIERLRRHGYSDHPHQWAAFITSGDWR